MDGVRGRGAVQKNAGLVEKVESSKDISVRHARRVGYLFLVLVLVLTHDLVDLADNTRFGHRLIKFSHVQNPL